MTLPPLLEDLGYAGRDGGYVVRITGKLLYEAATAGARQVFLPAPDTGAPFHVYAGIDASGSPLYEVPAQFYDALFSRIERLFGIDTESMPSEYDGVAYSFRLTRTAAPNSGMVLLINS